MTDSGPTEATVTRARDIMLAEFPTIHEEETLGDAIRRLVELAADAERPNVLVVVDADGRYEGILTARLLFQSLLGHWMSGSEEHADAQELYEALVSEQSERKLGDVLLRGLPKAKPADGVLALMELGCEKRLEYLPVVDNGTAVGIVPISRLFHAVANLTLTPEDGV